MKSKIDIKTTYDKFLQLPKFQQKFLKLAIFLLIMTSLAIIFDTLSNEKIREPNLDYFTICVIQDERPTLILLRDNNNLPLCRQNYHNITLETDAKFFHLKLIDNHSDTNNNSEWQITHYTDNLTDPLIFRYRVQGDTVVPLSWSYGGMMKTVLMWFIAFTITLFSFPTLKRKIKEYLNNDK